MKIRYIGKEPKNIVGGIRPIHLEKGDILELDDRKAKVYLRRTKEFEEVKEPKKKEKK